MAFDDISRATYKHLKGITKGKPYPATKNCVTPMFPLGGRRYSSRFFIEDEGVFRCYYGRRSVLGGVSSKDQEQEVARIHPDNSIEIINAGRMHQQLLLTAMVGTPVRSSSKHGGVVLGPGGRWGHRAERVLHPVFQRLRISLDDDTAVTPYRVYYKTTIPKTVNTMMDKYAEFLLMYPIMLKSMTLQGIGDMKREVTPYTEEGYVDWQKCKTLLPAAVAAVERQHYVDAALIYAAHAQVWDGQNSTGAPVHGSFLNRLEHTIARRFRNDAIRAAPDCIKLTESKEGELLKQSKWGYVIEVKQGDLWTGNVVNQF